MNKPFKPEQMVPILAEVAVSISDLKRNPAAVIKAAETQQVAILNRYTPVGYIVSPQVWAHVLDVLADRRLENEAAASLEDQGEDVTIDLDAYI
ncbi:type II toxin-antitoxin system Phd/YefM family antitoxin [Novosphingobium sp.]|uniref:type II toxin-antitoxin system Phd/YefM family antitoxin n=1 Tax=Novosphingobium sp. TaxID=1874826 RepID=UPI00286C2665|nr:type II toxin-antitoxin system Phd/YefM family antitoxin [Novosphingobium sp.]